MVIELLFTGEVYQYKDFEVYSSISGKNTISTVQQFSWKDIHKYGVFLWEDFLKYEVFLWVERFMSFWWLYLSWCEVSVLPLYPDVYWISEFKTFGRFQLEAPIAYYL